MAEGQSVTVTVKNIKGEMKPLNIFRYFDDGIRKRLPKNLAKLFKAELLENIERNTFNFQLSSAWTAKKRAMGADDRPFIMFRWYMEAIEIMTSEGHLSVGFRRNSMHPRAHTTYAKLAWKLEYGDLGAGIPARPLWRYSADKFFSNKDRHVKGSYDEAMRITN